MAIQALKENLNVNQIIGKSKENIMAEGDVIIPDVKPDILSTINSNGTICIYRKEILEGKIKIDGGVQVYIMYLADDENGSVRGINTVIDFSTSIDMENVTSEMNLETNLCLKEIECKILNGRKVNIKANIEADITISSNENIEFIREIENKDDVQILNTSESINSLFGKGETKVYAKDTISINNTDDLAEILKMDFNITNKEVKTSYNKILAKADMFVTVVYLTTENVVNEVKWQIPIMGFIDMQNISEDNLCDVNYEIKNILVKPNNIEEHSIYIEVELEISSYVFERKEINIIQDLYSPVEQLLINQKNIAVMQNKNSVKDKCQVKERLVVSELHNNKIINTEVMPRVLNQKIYNEKIIYECELEIRFMYLSNVTNRVDLKTEKISFNTSLECKNINNDSNLNTNIDVISQDFVIMPDGSIETNIELEICANLFKMIEINVIDSIDLSTDNDEKIYSMVVYFVKPGDTLWKIAKRFKSTIKAISCVNGIEDDKLSIGQQLFIPKYV